MITIINNNYEENYEKRKYEIKQSVAIFSGIFSAFLVWRSNTKTKTACLASFRILCACDC